MTLSLAASCFGADVVAPFDANNYSLCFGRTCLYPDANQFLGGLVKVEFLRVSEGGIGPYVQSRVFML